MKTLMFALCAGFLTIPTLVLADECRPYFSSIYDMYDLPAGSDPAAFDHTPYHVQSILYITTAIHRLVWVKNIRLI